MQGIPLPTQFRHTDGSPVYPSYRDLVCGPRDSFTFAPAPRGCTTSIALDTSACRRPLVFRAPASGGHHRKLQQSTGPLWSVENGTQLALSNTEFSGYSGRTIFSIRGAGSKYSLTNVTFRNNVGTSFSNLAPIEVSNDGSLQVVTSTFINNIYVQANGIYGSSALRLDISSCTFNDNNRQDGPAGEGGPFRLIEWAPRV